LAENKPEVLQRKVGLLETIAMITGLVIGAGIFGMVPTIAGMAGPAVFIAFIVACLPSLFVVLFEIQLTGTLPVTGANYVTVTRVLSPFWGGILSFTAVLAILSANVLVAVVFGDYVIAFIQSFNPSFVMDGKIFTIGILVFFSLINYFGVTLSSVVQLILFLVFVIGMLIFGAVGLVNINPANLTPLFPKGTIMFIVAVVLASYVWSGLIALADIGGEVKNPRRNLPLALIISFFIILVLYTMQPLALIGTMNWQEAAKVGSAAILVDAGKLLPGWGIYVIFIAAMGAILTTINALTMSMARDLVAWARDGVFPNAVAKIGKKFKTPGTAIIIVTVLEVLGVLVAATLDKYALATVLALMILQIIGAWAVVRIPKKLPDLWSKSIFKFNAFWRWFTFIGVVVTSGFIFLAGVVLDMMDDKGNPTKLPYTVFVFIGVLIVATIWWFARKAYLKSKGVDLEKKLMEITGAALAEIEGKQQ